MSAAVTGGPAFPQTRTLPCGSHEECEGMTLRDYFAAKAMHALLISADKNSRDECAFWIGGDAYDVANAMLEARQE